MAGILRRLGRQRDGVRVRFDRMRQIVLRLEDRTLPAIRLGIARRSALSAADDYGRR